MKMLHTDARTMLYQPFPTWTMIFVCNRRFAMRPSGRRVEASIAIRDQRSSCFVVEV
jgi:hypothetical protein